MKIFLICSKSFYDKIPPIKEKLEKMGYETILPNSYDMPDSESVYRGTKDHAEWKAEMLRLSERKMSSVDAVLVLNYDKNGIQNYLGGATFLEMYDAFRLGKRIFMMNDIPEGMLKDEIIGLSPIVINGQLNQLDAIQKGEVKHFKLVRDNIADIIKAKGEKPVTRTLSDAEYRVQLEKKLLEECRELIQCTTPDKRLEESSDILEVLITLGALDNFSLEDMELMRDVKRNVRGGFSKKLFLEKVITNIF